MNLSDNYKNLLIKHKIEFITIMLLITIIFKFIYLFWYISLIYPLRLIIPYFMLFYFGIDINDFFNRFIWYYNESIEYIKDYFKNWFTTSDSDLNKYDTWSPEQVEKHNQLRNKLKSLGAKDNLNNSLMNESIQDNIINSNDKWYYIYDNDGCIKTVYKWVICGIIIITIIGCIYYFNTDSDPKTFTHQDL